MQNFSVPITRLIHENLGVLMTFSFSRGPLERRVKQLFEGNWEHLHKAIYSIPQEKAERACLELALFLRIYDDEKQISAVLARSNLSKFGRLIMRDGSEKALSLRDVANKIIHSGGLSWDWSVETDPILVSLGTASERWTEARIAILPLSAACGLLSS
jgi:hypothetical protein